MENMIEVRHLCFEYEENQPIIQDVSFTIQKGQFVAILGHNGSGKSTIAKLLIGLLEKKSGEIIVAGTPLTQETFYDIRHDIGIVFQNPDNQFIGATVRDDIAFGLENKCVPPEEMDAIIDSFSKRVGMYDFLDHEPSKLSGGQKQRVAIAGILAMAPKILILDEATSMLDPRGKKEINELVKKLRQESDMTVISITHDIDEALQSDQVILLNQGKVEKMGPSDEILRDKETLLRLGLNVPFAYMVSERLKKDGYLDQIEIRQERLVDQLCQFVSKK
ncbi:Energy-coupling factor transporter ATP-binding protein EcfA1 [Clostridiales bacterium CHKCI006]|nr:Energy-coupling factor transporter ATP-binding protein EcfA1 [Clostridiales bacterium CHKCI006]